MAVMCGDCDGCGWTEGGRALMTTCKRCNGKGVVPKRRVDAENRAALKAIEHQRRTGHWPRGWGRP